MLFPSRLFASCAVRHWLDGSRVPNRAQIAAPLVYQCGVVERCPGATRFLEFLNCRNLLKTLEICLALILLTPNSQCATKILLLCTCPFRIENLILCFDLWQSPLGFACTSGCFLSYSQLTQYSCQNGFDLGERAWDSTASESGERWGAVPCRGSAFLLSLFTGPGGTMVITLLLDQWCFQTH